MVVDVRSQWEFQRGHVPGARHVPFQAVHRHQETIRPIGDDTVIVYCGHGPRAWFAGVTLRRLGFRHVTYLKGHMAGWRRAGLREERGAD